MKGFAAGLLILFVFLGLMSFQCLCDIAPSTRTRVPDFLVANVVTIRVYPKHTDYPSQPDHSELADYYWQYASDGSESAWQNVPHTGHGWAYFSSEGGWSPIVDGFGPEIYSEPTLSTGGYAIWRQESGSPYKNYVYWYLRSCRVQWDLTELPVGVTVVDSNMHGWHDGHFGGFSDGQYVPYAMTVGDAYFPGIGQHSGTYVDVDAGTNWIGGGYQWLEVHCLIEDKEWPLCDRTTPPGSPYCAEDCMHFLGLGLGHRSEGLCSYADISYLDPCSVSGLEPAGTLIDGDWHEVEIVGTGFASDVMVEIDAEWELGSYSWQSGTSIVASVRYVGE